MGRITSYLFGIHTSAIAERAMHFVAALVDNAVVTTVAGQMNLCIVCCRCFLDLLLDDVECVHLETSSV